VTTVVTIGNFDGVHLGHLALVARARSVAGARGIPTVAVTFDPHPAAVLRPEALPAAIQSLEERVAMLRSAGCDDVIVVPFDERLAARSPEEFVIELLVERLAAVVVVVGENFRFGRGASGDVEVLRRLGMTHGFSVEAVGILDAGDGPVSSSVLRELLAQGDVAAVARGLGREFTLTGEVVTVRLTATTGLTGPKAANYLLDLTGAPTASAAILARPLTVTGTFTVADKVYDGAAPAVVTTQDLTLSGFAPGETAADVTWTPTARFRTITAGTARTVELVGGAVLGGATGGGYVLDVTGAPTATATITPRPLSVSGAAAAARPYDGSTSVTVSGATLVNTVAGDAVTLANATSGVAASRDVGTRAVTTAMTLTGRDAANYRITAQPSLTVTITPIPLNVSMNPLPSRTYDTTTAVPLTAGAFSVSGTLPGESIAVSGTGLLSSRAAGTRTVTLTGPTFTPGGGTSLANYTLPTAVTGTIAITPLTLRVTGAAVTQRAWDGTTNATVTGATLEGVRGGDSVSLAGATAGVFASAQPGTHTVAYSPTLVGVDAQNYRLDVPQLTGTITRASATLRITGGLSQIADGSARQIRTAVSPATAGRIVVTYPVGRAPSAPGTYPVSVQLESATHDAPPVEATLTIQDLESLLFPGLVGAAGTTGTGATSGATTQLGGSDDPDVRAARMEQLMARMAVRPDGTLAMPEIGPVLENDGTAPALAPRDHRVLEDGEPSTARVTIVDQQRVRIERDDSGGGGFSIDLQAASADESRTPLPVDADGTLLLDRGGFVEVGGSGFLSGSTAEVWIFSTATFLGTAVVNADGSFEGSFPVDELLASGDHTIQLNGIGADEQVRSSSLGVRIDDPDAPSRERIVLATQTGGVTSGTSGWLLLLAALVGAGASRWWFVGRRRADDDENGDAAHDGDETEPRRPRTLTRG
jgi:riboflavin kinase/FMN adenylyltransferase